MYKVFVTLLIGLVYILSCINTDAQSTKVYDIKVNCRIDDPRVSFVSAIPHDKYFVGKLDTVKVDGFQFVYPIRISLPFPIQFRLFDSALEIVGVSEEFFLDTADFSISFSNDGGVLKFDTTKAINSFNDEYIDYRDYIQTYALSKLDAYYERRQAIGQDSIENNSNVKARLERERDSLSDNYTRVIASYGLANNNSLVSMSYLKLRTWRKGYHPIIDSAFKRMDVALRKWEIWKDLDSMLQETKAVSFGNRFPDFKLVNNNNKLQTLKSSSGKYRIIDFWFTHCGPCKYQFDRYKKIYASLVERNIEIIAISVDTDAALWKRTVKERKYPWVNLLSPENESLKSLNISSYPTSFYLDGDGVVLSKDDFIRKTGAVL
jgi:peroxiredoxin